MNGATDNPYAFTVSLLGKPKRNTVRTAFKLIGQLALFQLAFWGQSLYYAFINEGLKGIGHEILFQFQQIADNPEAGFVTFFGGPALLYVVVRLFTLRRFFPESWLRFSLTGALTFQVVVTVGPMALNFADEHFGNADWLQRTTRLLAVVAAVLVTLLTELTLAKLQSLICPQRDVPVANLERKIA